MAWAQGRRDRGYVRGGGGGCQCFRYFKDLHVIKSIKDRAKAVSPLVKFDFSLYE